jgi:CDP-6-deoxy-D-xylo-4-hexulose-3-dehydrase
LPYADEIVAAREKNFKMIVGAMQKNGTYRPIRFDHIDVVSNFAVPIICNDQATRDALVARAEGRVEVRPIVGGDITQQPFFKKYISDEICAIKNHNADLVHKNGLYCPNNPELTAEDINTIIDVIA